MSSWKFKPFSILKVIHTFRLEKHGRDYGALYGKTERSVLEDYAENLKYPPTSESTPTLPEEEFYEKSRHS
jgi:hypothetical protein